ncbi:MAG TPA: hypothetical protein VGK73_03435 [Polyangiaceae bacterium]
MKEPRYLGDGVYASFDGYHVWLRTGSHIEAEATSQVALDPVVLQGLIAYQKQVVEPLMASDGEAVGGQ